MEMTKTIVVIAIYIVLFYDDNDIPFVAQTHASGRQYTSKSN